jgi:hypothetical protein
MVASLPPPQQYHEVQGSVHAVAPHPIPHHPSTSQAHTATRTAQAMAPRSMTGTCTPCPPCLCRPPVLPECEAGGAGWVDTLPQVARRSCDRPPPGHLPGPWDTVCAQQVGNITATSICCTSSGHFAHQLHGGTANCNFMLLAAKHPLPAGCTGPFCMQLNSCLWRHFCACCAAMPSASGRWVQEGR